MPPHSSSILRASIYILFSDLHSRQRILTPLVIVLLYLLFYAVYGILHSRHGKKETDIIVIDDTQREY